MGKKLKSLVGVYSCALSLMSLIIPVPVLAQIAKSFPQYSIMQVQLLVSIPNLVAIPTGIVVSKFAGKVYKKYTAMLFTLVYAVGGSLPYFLHDSMAQLYFSVCLVGVALGGLQNAMTAIIPDEFDNGELPMVFGLLSTFVGLGGLIYSTASTVLGVREWYGAFRAYWIVGIFLVLELIFLPKGRLEPKREGARGTKVPKEILFLCIFGFVLNCVVGLFSANSAMLIAERGLGGTAQAGACTMVYTIAGVVAGIVAGPMIKAVKRHAPTVCIAVCLAGLALFLASRNVPMVAIAGFLVSISYNAFQPVGNMGCTNFSNLAGMSFNIALYSSSCSLGSAFSPVIMGGAGAVLGGGIDKMIAAGVIFAAALTAGAIAYFRSHDVTEPGEVRLSSLASLEK